MPPSGGDIRKIRGAPPKAIPMQTQGASRSSSELPWLEGVDEVHDHVVPEEVLDGLDVPVRPGGSSTSRGALIFNEEKRIRTNPSQLKPTGPTMS